MRKSEPEHTFYKTAGIERLYQSHRTEIRNAVKRFLSGDFGSGSQVTNNELINQFGSYELSFGTIWIISYHLFRSRDFITLLLPEEYEERSERT